MLDHAKLLFLRLLTSLKFWTVILGLTATGLARHGIVLPPDMANLIAIGFGLLLGGQSLADHGKEAAKINAASAANAAPPTVGPVVLGDLPPAA